MNHDFFSIERLKFLTFTSIGYQIKYKFSTFVVKMNENPFFDKKFCKQNNDKDFLCLINIVYLFNLIYK